MKIIFVSDTWEPQINGVVTTINNLIKELEPEHEIIAIEPSLFLAVPWPPYPEVKISINTRQVSKILAEHQPDAIHIFTEGSLGKTAQRYCLKNNIPFTTSLHTKFPEMVNGQIPFVPISLIYWFMRNFHNSASRTLVNTESHSKDLKNRGFENLKTWTRGIDQNIFRPQTKTASLLHPTKKNILCVGRVSADKNLEAFCALAKNSDYQCWVVGDGPAKEKLEKKYPQVKFVGYKSGEELANYYASADVCVFPSKTDTFGITIIESIACGTPVAGYPVTGPIDIIQPGLNGLIDEDLAIAVKKCLTLDREKVHKSVVDYSWANCAKIFINNLQVIKTKHV